MTDLHKLAETPTKETFWGSKDCAYRMDAYYFAFSMTGIDAIDTILSAVACAGKAYYHTESWSESCTPYHERHRGESPVEWIQNAADDAAEAIKRALSAQGEAVAWQYRTDLNFDGGYDEWRPISKAEYDFRVSVLGGRDSAPMAGTWGSTQNPLREDEYGWPEQVRALYTHPAPRVAADEAFEKIAESWDGCFYDDDLSETSIGDRLRSDWQRLSSAPAPRVEVDDAAADRALLVMFPGKHDQHLRDNWRPKVIEALTAALNPEADRG